MAAGHFTHPAQFSHDQIRRVLLGLTVQEHRTAVQRWIGENRGACRCFVMEKLRFWCRNIEALRLARKMSE